MFLKKGLHRNVVTSPMVFRSPRLHGSFGRYSHRFKQKGKKIGDLVCNIQLAALERNRERRSKSALRCQGFLSREK